MSKLEKLTYTPKEATPTSAEHPSTYVLFVDHAMYKRQQSDHSIPLAAVVDSYDVLKYDLPGHQGNLVKPSAREISDVFGVTDETALAAFMLAHGKPAGKTMKKMHNGTHNDIYHPA
jgi:hypothetical protein